MSPANYAKLLAAADGTAATGTALGASAAGRAGGITGLVHAAGIPVDQVCVSAIGAAGIASTRVLPSGRYLLSGLRPGHYRLRIGHCHSQPGEYAGLSGLLWPGQQANVTVSAGQLLTPPAATWWQLSPTRLAPAKPTGSSAAARMRSSVAGLVTGHGKPLRGICVLLLGERGPEYTGVTGKDGTYLVRHMRPGKYLVIFTTGLPRCPDVANWLTQFYPGVTSERGLGKVKPISVRTGQEVTGIDAKLRLGAEITGTVRTKAGRPIGGICIESQNQGFLGALPSRLTTGANGVYAIHSLSPGKYQVLFLDCSGQREFAYQWWKGATTQTHARKIKVTGTRLIKNVNATLLPGATVSGTVRAVTASGSPLRGVCVTAVASDNELYAASPPTTSTGTYQLKGLAAGTYRIGFDPTCTATRAMKYLYAQRTVTLTAGQAITGFDVALPRGGGISGLVTDVHGHPLSGVCVRVQDSHDDGTVTQANGTYQISGVPRGTFLVSFAGGCGNKGSVSPQYYPGQSAGQFAQRISFKPETITPGIDATMQPGGALAGTVTDTSGHQIAGTCIVVAFSATKGAAFYEGAGEALAAHGKYRLANLAPGGYDVAFGCEHYSSQIFRARSNVFDATRVAVLASRVTRVGAKLSLAATLTGAVTSQSGNPAAEICVEATRDRAGSFSDPAGLTITGKNGTYQLRGLLAGRYLVQFLNCAPHGRNAQQWYRDKLSPAKATPVTLTAGKSTTGIDAKLSLAGSISGLITGPANKPATFICVYAHDGAEHAGALGQTGKSGHYTVTGLSAGRYSLYAAPCGRNPDNLGSLTRSGQVTVVAGQRTADANLKLPAGGSMTGEVLGGPTGTTPIQRICVLAIPVNPDGGEGQGITDSDGHYRITGLAPGKYRAYFADEICDSTGDLADPFAPQWYHDQAIAAAASTFRVSAGATRAGIDGTLQSYGGVTGSVRSGTAPVAGECVTAVPYRIESDPIDGEPAQEELAITDKAGNYGLPDLTPGRYKIEFSAGCGASGFATQWWHGGRTASSASPITVKFATIPNVDATLRR